MKKLILFLLIPFLTFAQYEIGEKIKLENGYQYTVIDKLDPYLKVKTIGSWQSNQHQINHNVSLKVGDKIEIEIRFKELGNNGVYHIGINGMSTAFGFVKSGSLGGIGYGSRYNDLVNIEIKDITGKIWKKGEAPFNEWLFLTATLIKPVDAIKFYLGTFLYEGNEYDIRSFKVKGVDLTPETSLIDNIDNGGTLKTIDGYLFKADLNEGFVSPELYGYYSKNNVNQSTWIDASDVLQKCFDSGYKVKLNAGIYPIWKGLTIDNPTTIEFSGRGFVNNQMDNNSLTKIVLMDNIDAITINSGEVYITGGNIYTGLVDNGHTKSAYKYDINNKIIYGELKNITVEGSGDHLKVTGGGTIAININDTEFFTQYWPYMHFITFSGKIAKCNIGVNMTKPDSSLAGLISVNSLTFNDVIMLACKTFYNFEWGSNITVSNSTLQDSPVLTADEFGIRMAVVSNISHSDLEFRIYDMGAESVDNINFRHNGKWLEYNNDTTTVINNRFTR